MSAQIVQLPRTALDTATLQQFCHGVTRTNGALALEQDSLFTSDGLDVAKDALPPVIAEPAPAVQDSDHYDRDATIKRIRAALKERSGKSWSVSGSRGTSWGWITISAPPARRVDGYVSEAEQAELGELLGLGRPAHHQGEDIPAGSDYRREYIDRAEGREPSVCGTPYWD
jgi:hypothetical protein